VRVGEQDAAAVDLVGRATRAAGRVARTGWRVTRTLPGGARAERGLLRIESSLIQGVRGLASTDGHVEPVTLVLPAGDGQPMRVAMAELLNESANTDNQGAATRLHTTILRQLVPDEARIVAALADGGPRPAIDVVERSALRTAHRVVLRNASTVGRAAGVSAPEYVPLYVTRLYRLGVVDIGDEDETLAEQYDILLTDQQVRTAAARGTRIVRHTVALSELGRRFWRASDPTVP
jgi:hypothetical protein